MHLVVQILVGVVAAFHVYVMWLEMFAWTTRGPKVFKNFDKELFPKTKALAANQGLYNGFLAAGLIWTYFICNPEWQFHARLFFLGCVIVAGIYGAFTADKKIFFVQALPAIITVVLMHFVPWGCGVVCERAENGEIKGVFIGNHKNRYSCGDTLSLDDLKAKLYKSGELSSDDAAIDTLIFEFGNHDRKENSRHKIVLYSNQQTAPIDGDVIYAKMDKVGLIYAYSLSWGNYDYLHTSSDSLNELISLGLAKISANQFKKNNRLTSQYDFPPIKPLAYN